MFKYKGYKLDVDMMQDLYNKTGSISQAARDYCDINKFTFSDSFRRRVSHVLNKIGVISDTDTVGGTGYVEINEFKPDDNGKVIFNAIDDNGKMMDIETYCKFYGLDFSKVKSYKLVSHTGIPYYNIVFREEVQQVVNQDEIKENISNFLNTLCKHVVSYPKNDVSNVGVVKIADLHFGAVVEGLINTKDYSPSVLCLRLQKAAEQINRMGYDTVHVHILGDLVEAFDVKMHANTWKGLDKNFAGAEAIKSTVSLLHTFFLDRIENLGEVKIVAGNHDRSFANKEEDTDGGSANLVAWGLSLLNYDVEFNPFIITHKVGGICHILTHGHHGISKRTTQEICWNYGDRNYFNLICEGHLHSNIERLSVKQVDNFMTVKDDSVNHRRMNVPSFFTGNSYSEYLGYSSTAGFLIVEDNGEGLPNIFNFSL